jgi:ferredoxin-NADP reductase/nitrite reductase/ring-hydroxylating ferredoxin subunit
MAWYPVARSDDAAFRHVHQARLLGRELAVWRADDGFVNVWDNRCLHRGVRLSVGMNEGMELKCLYHGWRYANRTGGCTYIPAHPADAPARTICNRTFPSIERHGLVWTRLDGDDEFAPVDSLEGGSPFPLRALPFAAPPGLVRDHLSDGAAIAGDGDTPVWFVQPVDADACVVYGVLTDTPAPDQRIAVLRRQARSLEDLRAEIEEIAATRPRPMPVEPLLERIEVPVDVGASSRATDRADMRVVVARRWDTAADVVAFELAPLTEPLPTAQPGAHIDVHLPNGLTRQYSLTNPAGDQTGFVIAVKREPQSRGGSACLHDTVREGDELTISAPRNNFSLRRDAVTTTLIAGGIGMTPLLSMAETLAADGLAFSFHVFVRSSEHLAFHERLDELGDAVVRHIGLGPAATGEVIGAVLAEYGTARHLYICGPGPMLDAARAAATESGWPDTAVHFEYFANTNEIDRSTSFEISLARSGLTLEVPAGQSILEVLRANGVGLISSCEQGACGTCIVDVIDGDPIHHDVFLNATERAAGDRIATCVSRSASGRLVLDL